MVPRSSGGQKPGSTTGRNNDAQTTSERATNRKWLLGSIAAGAILARLIPLIAITVRDHRRFAALSKHLIKGDGRFYLDIATHGFSYRAPQLDGTLGRDGHAFFPLWPMLIRALLPLFRAASVPPAWVGPVLAMLAAITTSVMLGVLGYELAQRGYFADLGRAHPAYAAALLAGIYNAQPAAVTLSMGLSESWFTLCVALTFWAWLRRDRWILATAASAAALSRPTGAALAAAVVIALLPQFRAAVTRKSAREAGAITLTAALPAVCAALWPLHIGVITHNLLGGYVNLQHHEWDSRFDGGASLVVEARHQGIRLVRHGLPHTGDDWWNLMAIVAVIVAAVLLIVLLTRGPRDALMTSYVVLSFILVMGQSRYLNSKPRFLVPMIPLLFPLVRAGLRLPRPVSAAAIGAAVVTAGVLGGLATIVLTMSI